MSIFLETESPSTYHMVPVNLMFHPRLFHGGKPLGHSWNSHMLFNLKQAETYFSDGFANRNLAQNILDLTIWALPFLFLSFRASVYQGHTDAQLC